MKKAFNYLINFNFKEGFLRVAILATPIWIIYLKINDDYMYYSHSYSKGYYLTPETILYVVLINPITAYIFIRWIVIPPIKWMLKGFK